MQTKYFKKLEDGRTIFYKFDPFVSYILPEENLKETEQKIAKICKKANLSAILICGPTLVLMICMLFFFYNIKAIPHVFITLIYLLVLINLITPIILTKFHLAPVIKDFEKIKLEENKIRSKIFLVVIIAFASCLVFSIPDAISEIFIYKSNYESENENYSKAIKDMQIASKFNPKYKAYYLANMVYLKKKLDDTNGSKEDYEKLLAHFDKVLKKECAKNSTSCFYEHANRANAQKHLENYCEAAKDYESCLTIYDSNAELQKNGIQREDLINAVKEMQSNCTP